MAESLLHTQANEMRQRVVFVECAAGMGGVQFSTLYLAKALDHARWEPIVVCPEKGDLTQACRDAGIDTYVLTQPRLWSTSVRVGKRVRLPNPFAWVWNLASIALVARRLKRFLTERAADLVVTKGLASHFLGGIAARGTGKPCVWHVQDFISERNFGIYRRIFGLAARWLPDLIVVDGATIVKQLPRSLTSRISVVYNGVDTNVFRTEAGGAKAREELGIPKNHVVIGHAARITPWKGQHYLIEAFARIAHEHPDVTLLIVGAPVFDNDLYQRRLVKMAGDFRLQNRIKFAGYRHDLPSMLAAMDIFAFTSIEKDTSPLALLSAMSASLPIVAFDIEGVRELIDNDEQLLRVPAGQTKELSESLKRLIIDEQLRAALGRAARQLAENKFSLESYVAGIENVLICAQSLSANSDTDLNERASAPPAKTSVASAVRS